MRPLELGIFLNIFEGIDTDGLVTPARRWHELRVFARRAETLGFGSLWVPDHLLWRDDGGKGSTQGAWEAWSILAALAAET
jgi:alkanesulfonate monooxygenase SsuD/methylene tetrahydromethanopterin reductase-like flavin-dependent oxidoreductase (luciferase family)